MKTIICTVFLAALVGAEPPPSNGYLPPSASGRSGGYPKGPQGHDHGPQIAAARSLEGHGSHGNGFARSGQHGHGSQGFGDHGAQGYPDSPFARNGGGQGYDQNAAALARNALEEASAEPANYNFGYMVNDYIEGTDFGHHEERQEERAQGEYHVVLPDGRKQTVSYEADERGFKPRISYEDSDALSRSNGYDANANNVGGHHGNDYSKGGHSNHGNARSNGY